MQVIMRLCVAEFYSLPKTYRIFIFYPSYNHWILEMNWKRRKSIIVSIQAVDINGVKIEKAL